VSSCANEFLARTQKSVARKPRQIYVKTSVAAYAVQEACPNVRYAPAVREPASVFNARRSGETKPVWRHGQKIRAKEKRYGNVTEARGDPRVKRRTKETRRPMRCAVEFATAR